ncbi:MULTISPECIES: hypothetical protein [Natrialbaceae]|uniref:hypothetical protein n=1 Tax=Natrialbaceae TaxID=1644061 RepID=UPI00207C3984|nr:hypothetical protein [Natronococcus sp. CG52]
METIEERLLVRDEEAARSKYTPHVGATFIATDTGAVYDGDGTEWNLATRKVGAFTVTDSFTDPGGTTHTKPIGGAVGPHNTRTFDAGSTAADVNELIDAAHSATPVMGQSYVVGPSEFVTISSPVVLKSNVTLVANLEIADDANICAVKSRDFDPLTGSNTWRSGTEPTEVPYNFGFHGFIYGNRENNGGSSTTSVDGIEIGGVAFYGKNYRLGGYGNTPAFIENCAGTSFYSECGWQETANWTGKEKPEAAIRLRAWNGDGHGIVWRGPHDSTIWAVPAEHAGRGWLHDTDTDDSWDGYYDDLYLHSYSNHAPQLHANHGEATYVYVDNEDGIVDDEFSCRQVKLQAGGSGGGLEIGEATRIGRLIARGNGSNSGTGNIGVEIDGGPVSIGQALVTDWDSHGLKADGQELHVGYLRSESNGGHGILLGAESGLKDSYIVANSLHGNGEAAVSYQGGERNHIFVRSWMRDGDVGWDPAGADPRNGDYFDVTFNGGNTDTTLNRGTDVRSGDGSTSEFPIDHELVGTPRFRHVTPQSEDAGSVSHVTADESTLTVHYVSPPPAGAENLEWSWEAAY